MKPHPGPDPEFHSRSNDYFDGLVKSRILHSEANSPRGKSKIDNNLFHYQNEKSNTELSQNQIVFQSNIS